MYVFVIVVSLPHTAIYVNPLSIYGAVLDNSFYISGVLFMSCSLVQFKFYFDGRNLA